MSVVMNTEWITTSVMWYFRFRRYFLIVVSEANMPRYDNYCQDYWLLSGERADVLAISQNMISYEIEIKVTLADLRRDKKKWRKHQEYKSENGYSPHYFYYAVPKKLAKNIAIDKPYGLMTVGSEFLGDVSIIQKACQLPGTKLPKEFLLKHICRRVCAENINLREKLYRREVER